MKRLSGSRDKPVRQPRFLLVMLRGGLLERSSRIVDAADEVPTATTARPVTRIAALGPSVRMVAAA